MKLLIVDDDPQILRALRITLSATGYDIVTAATGEEAITTAIAENPDLVLLDLGLPGLDGVGVIEALRGWSTIPIIVVSGRSGSADKVAALDAGADDYVTKPFSIHELLARLRALSRRMNTQQDSHQPTLVLGDITVNFIDHTVTRDDGTTTHAIHLTPTEWQVLEILAKNPGRLVTRLTMLTEIWGSEHVKDSGYLRLYVSQLRKKLEKDPAQPQMILTEAGMGYRLNIPRTMP